MKLDTSEVRTKWGYCVTLHQALSTRVRWSKRSTRLTFGEVHAAMSGRNTTLNAKHWGAAKATPV